MKGILNRFKIPTVLGLAIIFFGIFVGVFLVARDQIFISRATPDLTPQDVTFSNLTSDSIVISWKTNSPTSSFINFGQQNPTEQTALDDQDQASPKPHSVHYVTLKNLLPKTSYQFKIISGKTSSDIFRFETPNPLTNQTKFTPIIGSVLDGDIPLNEGLVYLSVPKAAVQSSLVKAGNFLIPISQIRKTDLSALIDLSEEVVAKLTVYSPKGEASMLFKLKSTSDPLPSIKLGQNLDLTIPVQPIPEPSALSQTDKYDLNADGKINAADNALISSCFGKRPSTTLPEGKPCIKADINGDFSINQKDLDLMSQKLKELGTR